MSLRLMSGRAAGGSLLLIAGGWYARRRRVRLDGVRAGNISVVAPTHPDAHPTAGREGPRRDGVDKAQGPSLE